MALLILFLIWYGTFGRNNPKIYRALEDKIGKIVTAFIIFSIATSIIPGVLGVSVIGITLLSTAFVPLAIMYFIFRTLLGGRKKKDKYEYGSPNAQAYGEPWYTGKSGKSTTFTGLTRAVPKRRKIVKKFNDKYKLSLTEREIDRIVDASYLTFAWEKEISDMDRSYESIYEWYRGDTGWLRAYLKAFPVQSVSSDFAMQRKICLESFAEIFDEIDIASFATIDECVDAINNKFIMFFDETIFMVAYRFLEENGRKYDMPNSGILRSESELDRLKHKYDEDKSKTVMTV